jgi:hypothetical protein
MSDQLKELLHQAISDCCVRTPTGTSWLTGPEEVEEAILKSLSSQTFSDQVLAKTKVLKELESSGQRLKALLDYTEKQKAVKLSDVELDVARVKAKLEILGWVSGLDGDETDCDQLVDDAITELKRQLEALEKVLV